jgi:hypothetical protein
MEMFGYAKQKDVHPKIQSKAFPLIQILGETHTDGRNGNTSHEHTEMEVTFPLLFSHF